MNPGYLTYSSITYSKQVSPCLFYCTILVSSENRVFCIYSIVEMDMIEMNGKEILGIDFIKAVLSDISSFGCPL